MAQIAIALVLLTGAGLLVQRLWKMQSVESGSVTDEVLTLGVAAAAQRAIGRSSFRPSEARRIGAARRATRIEAAAALRQE